MNFVKKQEEEAYERGYAAWKVVAIDAIKNADVCITWNGEISAEDAADIAVRATKNSVIASIEDLSSVQLERKSRLVAEIEGKTPEETYDFLSWLMVDYGLQFTDTRQAIIEWLRGEQE